MCALASQQGGSPFDELGFEAARDKAKGEKKLLLVDFTASWCGPCKRMEKDTWETAEVRTWLATSAIAIQIDVDQERELVQSFKIDTMPTVVVLREGAEFDRIVGYKDATQFLAWGRGVLAGKSSKDELCQRAKVLRDSTDVAARRDLARDLARAGENDEALHHYLWLWPATREHPSYGGVRLSFMLSEMVALAKKSDTAKRAFIEILDGLQAKVDGPAALQSGRDWMEWIAFCRYFGETQRIVAWYEQHRDADGHLFAGREDVAPNPLILAKVFKVLIEAQRSMDAVRLFTKPQRRAEGLVAQYEQFMGALERADARAEGAGMKGEHKSFFRGKLATDMSQLYAVLLLAERQAEASDVAALLLQTLDTHEARMELVHQGLTLAKKADPSYARWLDEAAAAGKDTKSLRLELEQLGHDEAK